MVTMRRLIVALALLLLAPSASAAVGNVVGTNCTGTWTAPTTNTDGSPIVGALTYNIYIVTGVQTAPAVPPKFTGVTGTSFSMCTGLAAGQYTAFVTAVETPTPGGSSSESAPGPAAHFVLVSPGPPANVIV